MKDEHGGRAERGLGTAHQYLFIVVLARNQAAQGDSGVYASSRAWSTKEYFPSVKPGWKLDY